MNIKCNICGNSFEPFQQETTCVWCLKTQQEGSRGDNMISTPTLEGIINYLHYQYPPTVGDTPLAKFCDKIKQLQLRAETLEQEKDEANQRLLAISESPQGVVSTLTQQLQTANRLCEELQRENQELKLRVEKVEQSLSDLQEGKKVVEHHYKQLFTERDSLLQQVEELKANQDEGDYDRLVQFITSEIGTVKGEHSIAEAITRIKNERDALLQQVESLNASIAQLEQDMVSIQTYSAKQIKELTEQVESLKSALESVPLSEIEHDWKCKRTTMKCICFHGVIRNALYAYNNFKKGLE